MIWLLEFNLIKVLSALHNPTLPTWRLRLRNRFFSHQGRPQEGSLKTAENITSSEKPIQATVLKKMNGLLKIVHFKIKANKSDGKVVPGNCWTYCRWIYLVKKMSHYIFFAIKQKFRQFVWKNYFCSLPLSKLNWNLSFFNRSWNIQILSQWQMKMTFFFWNWTYVKNVFFWSIHPGGGGSYLLNQILFTRNIYLKFCFVVSDVTVCSEPKPNYLMRHSLSKNSIFHDHEDIFLLLLSIKKISRRDTIFFISNK